MYLRLQAERRGAGCDVVCVRGGGAGEGAVLRALEDEDGGVEEGEVES
jgi:hypothetical protein